MLPFHIFLPGQTLIRTGNPLLHEHADLLPLCLFQNSFTLILDNTLYENDQIFVHLYLEIIEAFYKMS